MTKNQRPENSGLRMIGYSLLSAVGGWIAYSALRINHHLPLPRAIDAERKTFVGETTGLISYYADRAAAGRPLLLVHSINAAASAYEMRPLFEQYRATRPVYAIDLPGFGFSERSDRVYTPELYTQAILDLLAQIGQPADVIALSLGSEFAARAALRRPDLVRSLTMISPSGFTARRNMRSSQQANQTGAGNLVYNVFSFPLWGRAFYDLLATRPSIRFFLKMSFEGEVDKGLADYDYATSHQPGAHHAPLYFVSGRLFSRNIREEVYEGLVMPVLVLYDRDAFVRFDELPEMVNRHPNWRAARITPTKGLPQFEKLDDVVQALSQFWEAPPQTPAAKGWVIESRAKPD